MARTHVVVIGAGIVGLSVAYHLNQADARVTLVERDPEGDSASVGNAGGIAVPDVFPASSPGVWWRLFGWMADPLGPLSVHPAHVVKLLPWLLRFARSSTAGEVDRISRAMAALNGRVYKDFVPMLEDLGVSSEIHRVGALYLYESEQGYRRDVAEWACKRARGIEAQEISATEARRMEPALGPRVHRAVFAPQWSHIDDPKTLVQRLRALLVRRGVELRHGEVQDLRRSTSKISLRLHDASAIFADRAVVAAGVWSGLLARRLGDRVLLESERGYNTTLPRPGISVSRQLIFAERKFVATPLSCGLRIGGAAEFAGLRAPANFKRSHALLKLAQRYLPDLQSEAGMVWAGHRPTTPDSLPVIGPSPREPKVLYAFGHGHFGLTQAATTGRLICDVILERTPTIDLAPYSIERFARTMFQRTTPRIRFPI